MDKRGRHVDLISTPIDDKVLEEINRISKKVHINRMDLMTDYLRIESVVHHYNYITEKEFGIPITEEQSRAEALIKFQIKYLHPDEPIRKYGI